MHKIYIGKSKLHNKGLIATHNIKKGELIFTITGKRVKFLIDNPEKADSISYNIIGVGKNTWIHPNSFGLMYNHSCNPNSFIKNKTKVFALRNIKRGEEVTGDYSLNEADVFWHFKCNCGSVKCRGVVRSIQFMPPSYIKKHQTIISKYYQGVFDKFNIKNFKNSKELISAWVNFIHKGFRV